MLWKKIRATKPPPPCGDAEHYYWVDSGWPCPVCAANKYKRKAMEDREDFAELIASKIAEKLSS